MAMDATKKKAIIYSVIFVCIIGLVFGLANLIAHVTKTNNHNEARYGVYRIRMAGWEGTQGQMFTQWARETLPELNRLGPTFQLVESGENVYVLRADIVENQSQCSTRPAIAYQVDTVTNQRRIVIDPVCIHGEFEFKAAFMHEVGHSLGMSHVCRANEQRSDCSSVGRGVAVMNPNLVYDSDRLGGDDFTTVNVGALPTWELQSLDFREFCRVRDCGRR